MTELFIDIESRSRVPLKDVGAYRYAEDPSTEILMAGWALDDDPVQVAFGEDVLDIPGLWDPTVLKVAHNAQFERVMFSCAGRRILEVEPGEYLPPEQWHDTMAVAAEKGYPLGLDELSVWLGGERKDSAGTALINWFCKPGRNGNFRRPEDHPEKWAAFVEYCRQDVVTHRDVHRRLGGFPTEMERRVYLVDQRINDRGIRVDVPMAKAAVQVAEDNRMVQELEIMEATGIPNPGSRDQMLAWLRGPGGLRDIPDLTKDTVAALLARPDLLPTTRRVLELRQELALIAAKKYNAALEGVCRDGRLRGQLRFFGAHTGRWSGRGVQLQNLPREQITKPDPETGKPVWDEAGENAAILDLAMGTGATAHTLKALVRPLFVGPFTVVDYAAIEARVIAWLAGEEWALEAFRAGRDIYVETAERMSTPGNQLSRSQGKVAVLALGYNGGVNSLRAMGASGSDPELQFLVDAWRATNPSIVDFWGQMGDAFMRGGPVGDHIEIERDGTSRHMRLPSGRAISYHGLKVEWVDTKFGRRRVASFRDPRRGGWRSRTYGGRLSENATQAVARDLLAEALVRLEEHGLPVAAHIHDEIVVEGDHPVSRVRDIMTAAPAWARGLPIDGKGFTCRRYRKG